MASALTLKVLDEIGRDIVAGTIPAGSVLLLDDMIERTGVDPTVARGDAQPVAQCLRRRPQPLRTRRVTHVIDPHSVIVAHRFGQALTRSVRTVRPAG